MIYKLFSKYRFLFILFILFSQFVFAQEKLYYKLSDFNVSGEVKSFSQQTENYRDPNDLVKNEDMVFLQIDPKIIEIYRFNGSGYLTELKSDYNLTKYEFSNDSIPKVKKIITFRREKTQNPFEQYLIFDLAYKENSVLIIVFKNGIKQIAVQQNYDKKGNVVEEHQVPRTSKNFLFQYDENNRCIKQTRVDKNKVVSYKYVLDGGEVITKEVTNPDNKIEILKYENGLLVSEKHSDDYVRKFSYEFDDYGNWTKKSETFNDILTSITYRTYTY